MSRLTSPPTRPAASLRDRFGGGRERWASTLGLSVLAAIGLVIITFAVFWALWAVANTDYDVWGGVIIGPLLLLATYPIARHLSRTERDPWLVTIIMVALVLKLLASIVRYVMTFEVYGSGDAMVYIDRGATFAEQVRQGDLSYEITTGGGVGTHFIRRITGYVFAVIGTTSIGGFFVFSWFGFLGMCLFYRAFRIAVPHGEARRYALLLFLLPTLLYWPSSVGKEAWMLLTLGLGAYGVARVLSHRPAGYTLFIVGLLGSAAVRPHMTALLAVAFALSFLLRRSPNGSLFGLVAKIVGSVIVVGATVWAIGAAEERFDVEGEGLAGAEQVIDQTAEQTSKGGSEFDAARPTSPLDVPGAVFTVMFRPLPHETHNLQALATSLEGVFLLGLFVLSWPRLRRLPKEMLRNPYVVFACTYSLMFMLAFSSFGNFGILARQRAQMFPLILIILALPAIKNTTTRRSRRGGRTLIPEHAVISPSPSLGDGGSGATVSVHSALEPAPVPGGGGAELVIDLPHGATRLDPEN